MVDSAKNLDSGEAMPATVNQTASRWNLLVSLCAALPEAVDLQKLLEVVVRKMADFFGADSAAAFIKKDGQFVPAAWVGFPEGPPPPIEIDLRRDLQQYLDRLATAGSCRRIMGAPMPVARRAVGALVVCSSSEGRPPYSSQDRQMLRLLAHRVAISVAGIEALERSRGQQEALSRIAAALASEVEVGRIAQTATDLAVRELGADGVTVWVARPEERMLDLLASQGFSPEVTERVKRLSFSDPTLASLTAATRRIHTAESLGRMPEKASATRWMFSVAGMQSAFDVPLLARGRLVGVLSYTRRTAHRWEPGERQLVSILADLLAAAIFNARLYEEIERRRLLAEAVIDNSPVAIAVIAGPDHRYVLVNSARERIGGREREELVGRTVDELFPGLAKGPVLEAIDRVYRTGENVVIPEFHYDFGPPAGPRELSLLYAPLRGPNGRVEGVISLMLDITEQVNSRRQLEDLTSRVKSANEQLVQANLQSQELATLAGRRAAELEAIIANIADAVFVCDPKGKITFINSAGQQMIGDHGQGEVTSLVEYISALKPRHLDGQPIHRRDLAISKALRGEVVRGVEEIVLDARLRRDRYILASAAPVRDPEARFLGAVEVLSDITRMKELDLLKDQFITVAAHEIKTPVTAIKGFAQTLARTPDACAPKYRRAIETIVQQSDRIDALVKDFLDVSGMRWGRVKLSPERIDLTALVTEEVARKAATAPRHHLVVSRKDPVSVQGDRERLNQVLENLLDNAIKFSPQGGEVEVQVRREADRAVVSVRDHGVGIPKERQSHLFDRFYRAHIGTPYDYGGLGVGLYISREIVRQHGGEIWFESEEGKGSTFYFSLPLVPE